MIVWLAALSQAFTNVLGGPDTLDVGHEADTLGHVISQDVRAEKNRKGEQVSYLSHVVQDALG